MNVRLILILSSVLLLRCQKKEKFEWDAAMSCPAYYVVEGPHVFYLREGEVIASSATLTHISGNWSKWESARSANYSGLLPDSVVVDYGGLNSKLEMCTYRGGISLPTIELEKMFRDGYIDKEGNRQRHRNITTGMAPGGRICIWVDHIEIKRGVVSQKDIYYPYPVIISSKKSREQDSLEINNYLKHHPVDYQIWEEPDPRYELDFGFCSEDGDYTPVFLDIFSKEGITNLFMRNNIKISSWSFPIGEKTSLKSGRYYTTKNEINDTSFKLQLPVHLKFSWQTKNKEKLYCTDIVLPKDFRNRFTKPYTNPETGRKAHFNRLVIGVEKDGEYCVIWLDGPGKQEKLMRFKGHFAQHNESGGIVSGGYATEVVYYD